MMARWSRRDRRVTLRWTYFILAAMAFVQLTMGCGAPKAASDDQSPEGVRVQVYDDPRMFGKACLIFTHDTSQGTSIAVVCG